MPTGIGALSIVQFGREATFGTPVAATHKLGGFVTVEEAPKYAAQLIDPSIDGSLFSAAILNIGKLVEWSITGVVDLAGLLMLYDLVYGAAAYGSTGAVTTGAGPYTHVFKARTYLNSYTLQIGVGDVPTGKVRRVSGAKAQRLEVKVAAGGGDSAAMQYTLSGLGSLLEDTITPTAGLNQFARVPVYFTYLDTATATDGTATAGPVFTEFGFSIENALAGQRFQLGYDTLREPIREGKVIEKMTFRREHTDELLLQAWLAQSDLHPIMKFVSGALSLQFEIPKGRMTDYNSPVDGPSILSTTYEITALKTAGSPDHGSILTAIDSQALITTAA